MSSGKAGDGAGESVAVDVKSQWGKGRFGITISNVLQMNDQVPGLD